jgi:predicted nucleic acid-binding Zn ribbon protein
LDETGITEVPCHSRCGYCGTIKIAPYSKLNEECLEMNNNDKERKLKTNKLMSSNIFSLTIVFRGKDYSVERERERERERESTV